MPVFMEAFPGAQVTCSVTGSHPMYTTILSDSRVLVNTTSMATFWFEEEGNYTCMASSKYGTDLKVFSVIFPGRPETDNYTFSICFTSVNRLPEKTNGSYSFQTKI